MDDYRLKVAADKARHLIHQEERFVTANLAQRLTQASAEDPEDGGVALGARVLGDFARREPFISRAQLNAVYEKLHTAGTALGTLLKEELARPVPQAPTKVAHSEHEGERFNQADHADPVLLNALSSLFEGGAPCRLYAATTGKSATSAVETKLAQLQRSPKNVRVFAGQEDVILCQASYDTVKGMASVLVPVEVSGGEALPPNMFFSRAGFVDLDELALDTHLETTAGRSYRVDGEVLLKTVSAAKGKISRPLSDVEMAAFRMRTSDATPGLSTGNFVYAQVEDATEEVKTPTFQLTAEEQTLSERLESPQGAAAFLHSPRVVEASHDALRRELAQAGHGYAQISIADADEEGVYFAVSLANKQGLRVPVKISKGTVTPPSFGVCGGKVVSLTAEGIGSALGAPVDRRAVASASPDYDLKPSDLLSQVKASLEAGDTESAANTLHVLAGKHEEAYREGMALLGQHLSGHTKTAEAPKCAFVVKNGSSGVPLCGHLNLPLERVWQDEDGHCRPLHRKNEQYDADPVAFLNHNLFV